jgi:hypothetical protein
MAVTDAIDAVFRDPSSEFLTSPNWGFPSARGRGRATEPSCLETGGA